VLLLHGRLMRGSLPDEYSFEAWRQLPACSAGSSTKNYLELRSSARAVLAHQRDGGRVSSDSDSDLDAVRSTSEAGSVHCGFGGCKRPDNVRAPSGPLVLGGGILVPTEYVRWPATHQHRWRRDWSSSGLGL